MFVNDLEDVVGKMRELRAQGVYGFPWTTLAWGILRWAILRRLPLDQLKIDQEFVRGHSGGCEQQRHCRKHYFPEQSHGPVRVIAEGVETEGQRDFLSRLGCHSFQGYLFGAPVPVGEFQALLVGLAKNLAHR